MRLGAEGVVICVVGGSLGTGACMALDYGRDMRAARFALAFVLRGMATDLERGA